MPPAARPPIGSLTTLRFFAALHVVLYHYGQTFLPEWAAKAARAGPAAVAFFFVLSGFILTYNYGGAFEEAALTRRSFLLARFARIYPLYAALVLVELALMLGPLPARVQVAWPTALAHLFMLQGFFREYFHHGNVPGWSIGAEAFFYLLFPWVQRRSRSNERPLLFALMALSYVTAMGVAATAHYYAPSAVLQWCFSAPIVVLPEFVFGVALGWLYRLDLREGRRLPGDLLVVPATISIAVLTVHLDIVPELMGQNGFLVPLYGTLIYGLSHGGRIARILSARPLVFLGELGFAIYLLQVPIYQAFIVARIPPASGGGFLVYLATLVAASTVVYLAFERPLQRALRRGPLGRLAALPDGPRDRAWLAVPALVAALLVAMQLGVIAPFGRPVLGAEPVDHVLESGFHFTENLDGKAFRWTNGSAWVRVPVDRRPSSVRVTIGSPPRPETTIRILVDSTVRFEGRLPEGGFSQDLSLQGVSIRQHLHVAVESSTFVPSEVDPANGDTRVLGVPLYGIELSY